VHRLQRSLRNSEPYACQVLIDDAFFVAKARLSSR
jgi:hypothetical protein